MGILTGWLQRRRDREDEERFRNYYGELQNQQNFQQGVVEPATRGVGILPGVDSITAGIESGAVPIDPAGGGAQDIIRRGGDITPPSMDLLKHPVYGQMARDLFMEVVKNNPAILATKNRQELQQEIQKAILGATREKVDQNLLGLDELEPTFRNPSLLPRDRILQNLGEREAASTTGTEQAKEPFRDAAFQRSLRLKQSPTYKQMQGGGGGGDGGSFNVPGEFLNRAEKEIMRDKSGLYASTPEPQSWNDKPTPQITDRGLRVMQIAEDIAAKSKNRQPLSIINEAKAREKKEFVEQQKATEDVIQGADRAANQVLSAPPPAAPAPVQRAAEVQTGRDPVTENKIQVLRQKGVEAGRIRQALIEDGINPAEYGY